LQIGKTEKRKVRESENQNSRTAEKPRRRTAIANSEIEDRDLKLAAF
jgi:hypothetical protein